MGNQYKNDVKARLVPVTGLESPLEGMDYINVKTPITYYGGKQRMASLILSLIPKHKLYCEPFAGGAAVFFAKEKSEMEVINDLNGDVVNFYQVCKTDFDALHKLIQSTPHSRKIHQQTQEILKNTDKHDKLNRVWAFWAQTNMSFASRIFGGYAYERKSNGTVKRFVNKKLKFTPQISDRLDMVDIECNDGLKVIQSRDTTDSFFYIDPPYFNSDMGHYDGYTEKDFINLLKLLKNIKGKFLLSSYPSKALDEYIKKNKWFTHSITRSIAVTNQTDKVKTEVLTANYDIIKLLKNAELSGKHPSIDSLESIFLRAKTLRLRLQLK